MFHFPASPPAPYELQTRVTPHNGRRVPPFGNPRITARKPAPRGISQATTSFIGPQCQGIHRTLITTNTHKQLNKHNHDTCGTRRPATTRPPPPNQERRKQERRGRTGQPAADREPQNINIETPRTRQPGPEEASHIIDARVHYAVHNQPAHTPSHNSLRRGCSAQGAPPQNPTACHAPHPQKHNQRKPLRKEVIQPHLPVRLPCYDFVPITGPAFDRSP